MKISWGIKIIFSFIVFALGIAALVAVSISKNTDLISEDYYEQEIKYQNHIDLLKTSLVINDNINIEEKNGEIIINYLNSKESINITGVIHFYRPSDAKKDFTVELKFEHDGRQVIQKNHLGKGSWKLKFNISKSGEKYYVEKNLFIN